MKSVTVDAAARRAVCGGGTTWAELDAEALPWDLDGRLPHHWLPADDQERSTVDLIGDALTLLAGPTDPRWTRFADTVPPSPPIDVHVLDAARTADALDLPPAGALLARPDGRELQVTKRRRRALLRETVQPRGRRRP